MTVPLLSGFGVNSTPAAVDGGRSNHCLGGFTVAEAATAAAAGVQETNGELSADA